MNKTTMALGLVVFLIVLGTPGVVSSENGSSSDPTKRVRVPLNGVKIITTDRPVNRVVTGKTQLLSVQMASSREIMVFGLQAGVSTLHVWTDEGLSQYFLVVEQMSSSGVETDLQKILKRQEEGPVDGQVMRVFEPQYRDVGEFERFLNQLLGEKGTILLSDPPSGKIFVVGPGDLLGEAEDLVNRLDVPGDDKRFTKRISLKNRPAKEMEPKVKSLLTEDGKVIIDEETNSVLVIDTVQKVKEIQAYLDQIDVPTVAQVRIEARFVELTDEATKELGINWTGIAEHNDPEADITATFGPSFAGDGLQIDFDDNFPPGLDATLRALEEKDLLNLISSPNVVTRNQQKAVLEILNERSFIAGYSVSQVEGAQALEPEIDTVQDGITINVTPLIGKNDIIQLDIIPELQIAELTRVNQDLGVGNAAFFTPSVDRRRAELNVAIKDGQTLVIGGLNRQEKTTTKSKVPLLGDIPGIGWAFRQNSTTTDNRNISIFLTAEIVELSNNSPTDNPAVSRTVPDTESFDLSNGPFLD